jgi:hypothetical protein
VSVYWAVAHRFAHLADPVTLFGGIGGDGTMVVCGLEEIHSV